MQNSLSSLQIDKEMVSEVVNLIVGERIQEDWRSPEEQAVDWEEAVGGDGVGDCE